MPDRKFDVVVIGGGHAGTEAAAVAARMGARTALLTHRLASLGALSCNPSIGGIGKSHLVREVDALGGLIGRAADAACLHNKLLNRSKGPAVRGTRIQADRETYRTTIQAMLQDTSNLDILEGEAAGLILAAEGHVTGVAATSGMVLQCRAVVICTGTFLNGMIHTGHQTEPAGRFGEPPSLGLADCLRKLGVPLGRLKTGTPPRLERSSIDWHGLDADHGDADPSFLGFMTKGLSLDQLDCRITGTNTSTHAFIRANLKQTALYGGSITARGPRYCPSIEDKVVRFADREKHQIFLEPEGRPGTSEWHTVYPNGISTSLPASLQNEMVHTIAGLEHARIVQPGYAVEYDFVQPTALKPSLELHTLPGVFLAGQINGTTGYEEAAGQGIMAGMNAARLAGMAAPIVLDRASSYIGVMIDDLVSKGVTEPYRMLSSRAEYRLQIRCDNADLRLTPTGIAVGSVSGEHAEAFGSLQMEVAAAFTKAQSDMLPYQVTAAHGLSCKQDGKARGVLSFLGRDAIDQVAGAFPWLRGFSAPALQQLVAAATYGGYIARQDAEIRQLRASLSMKIPAALDYDQVPGLSTEARETLDRYQPQFIGDLDLLEGVTPSGAAMLAGYVRAQGR